MRTNLLLTTTYKKSFFLVLLWLTLAITSFAQTWTLKAPVTGNGNEYDNPIHFTVNSKIYVGGGLYGMSLKEFDVTANTWTAKANIPSTTYSRTGSVSFSINGKGYVGLGLDFNPGTFDYTYMKDMQEYNPVTNTWTAKANFPGTPRTAMAFFVINNKGYMVGGNDTIGGLDEVWEFDPTANTWTQKADYPAGLLSNSTGFSIGAKGYVATGNLKVGASPYAATKKIYEFDPVANTWTAKADYPGTARFGGTAFVMNNKAYVGLGASIASMVSYAHYDDFYAYDATTGWGPVITTFPGDARQHCISEVANNKGYVGTGWTYINGTNTYYKDWYEFSSTTGIENTVNASGIVCFPNPAKDAIYIQQPQQSGKVSYALYNTLGQKVLLGNLATDAMIVTSQLPSGQYYLELSADNVKYHTTRITLTP